MSNTTLALVASLVEQSESRLNVVIQYLNKNPELATSPIVAAKIEELRQSLNEVDAMIKRK